MLEDKMDQNTGLLLQTLKPYDFALSLLTVRSFQADPVGPPDRLLLAAGISGVPSLIEVRQNGMSEDSVSVVSTPPAESKLVRSVVDWVLFNELDLSPFYRLTGRDPKLKSIVHKLNGLKPMRPITLFEMAVTAVTEQQISLAAAYRIRAKIVQTFGKPVASLWVFPPPDILAGVTLENLQSCGLSRQKAQYIHDLAVKIMEGSLNLEALKRLSDDEARETILGWRGFGRWSADYILVRGLARPDCVPIDDLTIRSAVGEYLGDGSRETPQAAAEKLAPFSPYRGLLAFYLLAAHRLGLAPHR